MLTAQINALTYDDLNALNNKTRKDQQSADIKNLLNLDSDEELSGIFKSAGGGGGALQFKDDN